MILRESPSSWFHGIVRTPCPAQCCGLNLGLQPYKVSVLPLNDILSPRFMILILGQVLTKLPSLALNPFNSLNE